MKWQPDIRLPFLFWFHRTLLTITSNAGIRRVRWPRVGAAGLSPLQMQRQPDQPGPYQRL